MKLFLFVIFHNVYVKKNKMTKYIKTRFMLKLKTKKNFFCVFAYNSRVGLHEKLGTKSLQKYAKN